MRIFNKCHLLLLLAAMVLVPQWASAQQAEVSARILDGKTNDPIPGVTVTIPGTSRGTTSGLDGSFRITAAPDEELYFNFIGYESLVMSAADVANRTVIVMNEEATQIDDIVVVGYGTQRKASVVAAISQTKGEELLKTGNVTNVAEALQGKLNGVVAINSSGKPGDNNVDIYIRGKGTWHGTSPLVLVDGVERNMNDVDMHEIETISVLKDASATAVYGIRGANGVILLTTKRGTSERPTISFNASFGFKQPTRSLNFSDYVTSMRMYNEAMKNDNNWSNLFSDQTIAAWENAYATGMTGPYSDVFPDIDWQDQMVQVGTSQSYNVNVSGRSDFMSYFASVGYQNDGDIYKVSKQEDYDPRHYYRRYNWRSNFDFNLTNTTVFSVKIAGMMGYRNSTFADDFYRSIINAPSNSFPIKYSNGIWGDDENQGSNPLANISANGQIHDKIFRGWYDASLVQKLDFITPGLRVRAMISYNSSSRNRNTIKNGGVWGGTDADMRKSTQREWRIYDYDNPVYNSDGTITYEILRSGMHGQEDYQLPVATSYDVLESYTRRLYYDAGLEYDRSFGDHNVTGLALVKRENYQEKDGNNLIFPRKTEDWIFRVTYNWKERYLAEFNAGYTGSDRFAPGNRFGFFPSYSVGWRVSEEPFMQKTKKWLSNLKVRYSWGQAGNESNATRWGYVTLFMQDGNVNFGGTQSVGYGPTYRESTIGQADLTWETSTKQNLGIEMGLWNRLNITLDLYDEHRKGIFLAPRTVSRWVGAEFSTANLGRVKNHGIDLEISWNHSLNKDFRYYANFAFSASENRVTDRDDPSIFPQYQMDAGKPVGWQQRYIIAGNYYSIDDIFNAAQTNLSGATAGGLVPGDFVYIDYNGDGVIDDNDQVVWKYLNYPLTTYSLTLGFDFKGLGFSCMWYAPTGVYKQVPAVLLYEFPNGNVKTQPNVLDRWTRETANTSGIIRPALHINNNHNNQDHNYRYRNFSYLRLKNVEVNYSLPKAMLAKASISACQFFVNGNNLVTFQRIDSRIDPETDGATAYPIVRSYTLGVRLTF